MKWQTLAIIAYAVSGYINYEIDNIENCLIDLPNQSCNPARICSNRIHERVCLSSEIKFSLEKPSEYDRISCCFKCCFEYFLSFYKLVDSELSAEKSITAFGTIIHTPKPTNLVYSGLHSSLSISKHAVSNIGMTGNVSVMQITTVSSTETKIWKNILGRRIILITPITTESEVVAPSAHSCVWGSVVASSLSAISQFNSPRVISWFTTQLPCHWSKLIFKMDTLQQSGSSDIITPDHKLIFEFVDKNINLIPSGVEFPNIMESVNRFYPNLGLAVDKTLMVDCSCAHSSPYGAKLAAILVSKGFIHCEKDNSYLVPSFYETFLATKDVTNASNISNSSSSEKEEKNIFNRYLSLQKFKFSLSPSQPGRLSHCEWEALQMGAIPIIAEETLQVSHIQKLLYSLPLLSIPNNTWQTLTPLSLEVEYRSKFSQLRPGVLMDNKEKKLTKWMKGITFGSKSKYRHYSLAKIYLPFWFERITQHLISAKPPARFFHHMESSLQRGLPVCTMEGGLVDSMHGEQEASPIPSELQQIATKLSARINLMDILDAVPEQSRTRSGKKKLNRKPKMNQILNNLDGKRKSDLFDGKKKRSEIELSDGMSKRRRIGDDLSHGMLNHSHSMMVSTRQLVSLHSNSESNSNFRLEIVVPRCCEGDTEFSWLHDLLNLTKIVKVTIYYKCPACLPKSVSSQWISSIVSPSDPISNRTRKGILLLDDSNLVQFGNRVKQDYSFDTIYNGKEVTSYLKHILLRYDTLADQSVFLHTVPNAHIYFNQLYRVIKWAEHCKTAVPFMHLNVRYKEGVWGQCCGKKGACRKSTWNYLFDNQVVPDSFSTYSSSQFSVPKEEIVKHPYNFWEKMLLAINGSVELDGCRSNSEPGVSWGGHQLTGQYERMWHVIFGKSPHQLFRSVDLDIPKYFRHDCDLVVCDGAV